MLENTKKLFKKYIDKEAKKLNNNYNRIILGGHSLGAMMAFHTGLTINKKLGGIFILSGYLFHETTLYDEERKNLNMFMLMVKMILLFILIFKEILLKELKIIQILFLNIMRI